MSYLRKTQRLRKKSQCLWKNPSKAADGSRQSEASEETGAKFDIQKRAETDQFSEDGWRMKESVVESRLVSEVEKLGGLIRKVEWIGRRGAPDRVVMIDGLTIWVELKAPGKTADDHQLREHRRMLDMKQDVRVIDSVESVVGFVNELRGLCA